MYLVDGLVMSTDVREVKDQKSTPLSQEEEELFQKLIDEEEELEEETEVGQALIEATKDVLAYEKGEKDLRTTEVEIPEVKPVTFEGDVTTEVPVHNGATFGSVDVQEEATQDSE